MSNNAKNLPEVKLGQYKGLAVTRHVRPLSEKTIDQEMVHQTRMRSVYHNSTAPAKRGSRVLLDFVGFMDGEEIPDSRMEKVMVVLGDGKLMPAAEDAIYGHTAGETFRFDFTYPEQFRVEELSGKTAQFEIKLHSVAEKTTPELNEEFARAQGYADLAAMREAVRAKKRKIHEDAADRAAGQELLAKAGANLTVDLPEAMLDRTADNEMRMLEQRLSRSNITLEKHCKNSHTTAAALRAGYRDAAERNLRSMLASRSIAEAENITVSTLEVNNEYRRLSQLQDTPEAEIRKALPEDTIAAALAAGCWRDMTRVSLTDPDRTRAMVEEDSLNVEALLRRMAARLTDMADQLHAGAAGEQDVMGFFAEGDPFRRYKAAVTHAGITAAQDGTATAAPQAGTTAAGFPERELAVPEAGWQQTLLFSARRGEAITGFIHPRQAIIQLRPAM